MKIVIILICSNDSSNNDSSNNMGNINSRNNDGKRLFFKIRIDPRCGTCLTLLKERQRRAEGTVESRGSRRGTTQCL